MLSVTVNLLTILALTGAATIGSIPKEEFSCERYDSVNRRFKTYLESNDIEDITRMLVAMMSDGVISGSEFLENLTSLCSNEEWEERLVNSVERITADCPGLQQIINSTVENKISFFCENDHPTSMISDFLQSGYSFRKDCAVGDNPVMKTIRNCARKAYSEIEDRNIRNLPVSDVLSIYSQLGHSLFQCTLDETGNERLECGSTSQDILVTFWLLMSGNGYLSPTIREEKMAELMNMTTSDTPSGLLDILSI